MENIYRKNNIAFSKLTEQKQIDYVYVDLTNELNFVEEAKHRADELLIQYGRGKKPCKRKACIAAQRMFRSWPTWALALMIGVQGCGEQAGHSMNSEFGTKLHCAWCLRWDPSGACCP